jgi:hypothetical protein
VDAVVLAQAMDAQPGRVAKSDNGGDELPFELVGFEVLRALKGANDFDRVVVERAGGAGYEGKSVFLDADGGPFEIGGIYLLFLKRQSGTDYYYQVNHQGRYELVADRFEAVDPGDPVARYFDGVSLEEGFERAQTALRDPRPVVR